MSAYRRDRDFTELFVADIRSIVGPRLMVSANHERDCREATDFLVLIARDVRIAARMRRHKALRGGAVYAEKYPWDITMRAKRDTGAETELSKIAKGFGDWMFYGHATPDEKGVARWMIVDLHVWRSWWECQRLCPELSISRKTAWGMRPNIGASGKPDGTHLAWFNAASFSPYAFGGLLIDASHPIPNGRFPYGTRPTSTGMDVRS